MKFINLTPHVINVLNMDGGNVLIEPSGQVARVSVEYCPAGQQGGCDLYASRLGEVEGLPEPQEGVIFVVSMLIRNSFPNRKDLASPGELVRDKLGRPKGCKGLVVNF